MPSLSKNSEYVEEWERCVASCAHFLRRYVRIYDATPGVSTWIPFDLWPMQVEILEVLDEEHLVDILKARQQGFSWLLLGYALWLMLCKPAATVLIFSKRDEEAIELLDFRLKGMYEGLPDWLRDLAGAGRSQTDAKHQWLLSNGSRAMAFPTTGGRSYTATFVLVDEADFIPNLGKLLNAVKPTIDAGGQLALVSTPDKEKPESEFKRIFQAGETGENDYCSLFYGWNARPGRTPEWYEAQKRDVQARTGSLDDLYQEYPETVEQALSPNSQDKRIPAEWLLACYRTMRPLEPQQMAGYAPPAIPGLQVYRVPVQSSQYILGADPAEGNPTSDDSSLHVVERVTGEEVASLSGKYQPKVFAGHIKTLSTWFRNAGINVERNNHGHAVILALQENGCGARLVLGTNGQPGWLTTSASKALMYDQGVDAIRQGDTVIHTRKTYLQLTSIEGATLNAPEGQMDDSAVSYMLALLGRSRYTAARPPATGAIRQPVPGLR